MALPYSLILEEDLEEHRACPLRWDCAACTKTLCVRLVAVAEFPSLYGSFLILGFTNNKDGRDHSAVVKGEVTGRERVLTRIHSSCATGDALGSLRCDCGPQLHHALELIEAEGEGVLLYMQQEGRGIGLTNKLRAYMLQDRGADTYEANVALGFKPDERDYEVAAAMLGRLGVASVRLLTNNPEKVSELERYSIHVSERVPLVIHANPHNRRYMETKRDRFNHAADPDGGEDGNPCRCNG